MTEKQEKPLKAGDIVRVKNPDYYTVDFAKRIIDRDAVVLWVGPIRNGMFANKARVRFLKRNGRGKEFEEVLHKEDFVLKDTQS